MTRDAPPATLRSLRQERLSSLPIDGPSKPTPPPIETKIDPFLFRFLRGEGGSHRSSLRLPIESNEGADRDLCGKVSMRPPLGRRGGRGGTPPPDSSFPSNARCVSVHLASCSEAKSESTREQVRTWRHYAGRTSNRAIRLDADRNGCLRLSGTRPYFLFFVYGVLARRASSDRNGRT